MAAAMVESTPPETAMTAVRAPTCLRTASTCSATKPAGSNTIASLMAAATWGFDIRVRGGNGPRQGPGAGASGQTPGSGCGGRSIGFPGTWSKPWTKNRGLADLLSAVEPQILSTASLLTP